MADKFGNNDNIHNDEAYDKARETGQVIENQHVADGNPLIEPVQSTAEPQNPNHDADPTMNQSNANLGNAVPVEVTLSYDEEQKRKDLASIEYQRNLLLDSLSDDNNHIRKGQ